MTNPDPFRRVQDEYFRLKGQLATGRITREQFETALKALMVQDAQGRYWILGADSGKWNVHDGGQWIESTPPQAQDAKPLTLPERGAPPSAPPPAFVQPPSNERKSNNLPLVLIGALFVIALGIVAFFIFSSNLTGTNIALQPTSVPVANPTVTFAPLATASANLVRPTQTFTASATATANPTATLALVSSNAPNVQVAVIAVTAPSPIAAKDFTALNVLLAEKIAALNFAELKFIRDARQSSLHNRPNGLAFPPLQKGTALLDQDLKDLAGKAMEVAILADQLGELSVRQDNGSAQAAQSGEAYANIARNALALVIDAQTLREQLLNNLIPGAQGVELIAQYGVQLWNNEVTDGGTPGNPFNTFVKNAEPSQTLNESAASQVQAQFNAGAGSIWIAQSASQTNKTIDVPPAQAPIPNPFDPQVLKRLTTAEGQNDGNKAQQVAAAMLSRVGAATSSSDPTKPTQLQISTSPVAVAESGQIRSGNLPTFPAGTANVVAKNNSGGDNPFIQTFGLNGVNPPTDEGKTQVQDAPPLVNLTIMNINITNVNKKAKGSSTFEAEVTYDFTVNWNTNLKSPQFELDCVSGNHFEITTASGSQHVNAKGLMILYPGNENAYCYASHGGNTWGTASVSILVGDAAEATVRVLQVETDSENLNRTLTADARGTESAEQTQAASTVQVLATQHALETEVGSTKTAEFKLTANAFGTKQAQPPPDTATPSVTPTFTPKVIDQLSHPGNVDAVSTNVVLERGRLYRFTFVGQVNLIEPTRSVSASDLPEHVNGVAVPPSGVVVVEGTGGVAAITCGSGIPDPDNPGGFGITVEDLGPL